ncbi:MAG: FtsX-like permease family protein [Ilumatobacteraceae bacterium]
MSRRRASRASALPHNGGRPGRRAVMRWAWRMFAREWRQQVLVLVLLTVSVAAAIGLASAAYNLAPIPGNAQFGTASSFFTFEQPTPATLPAKLAAATQWFGSIDAIGHRLVSIPGSVKKLDYRSQDPHGPFGGPMLTLRSGRYPTTDNELAVTDGVATTFNLRIGTTFALDGVQRTVVGIVENPSKLDDEFALVTPSQLASSNRVDVLVDASQDRLQSFRPPGETSREIASRGGGNQGVFAAVGVLAIATVALLLVALVAAASFIVLAQRRLRQLGMLAAVGATERQVRLVMVAGGVVTGVVSAVVGAAVGIAGWVAASPSLENALGYRIDAFNVPWWLIIAGMLLAIGAATAAAWWPARAVARVPIVRALSGRPPHPTPVHRSAALAISFIAAGVTCLGIAGDVATEGTVHWNNVVLVAAGTLATVVGVLLICPLAIRALARTARRMPIAVRLALRDLARYQSRSSAALAAISLVLGIPVMILVVAASAAHASDAGNLSNRQLVVRAAGVPDPFVPQATDVPGLQAGVDKIAATLDHATVVRLDVALDPTVPPDPQTHVRLMITLGLRENGGWRFLTPLFIATPKLLSEHGVGLPSPDSGGILTDQTGDLGILGTTTASPKNGGGREVDPVTNPHSLPRTYTSVPGSFITAAGAKARGWEVAPSGWWLVETDKPLTRSELSKAREAAASSGLTIESRDDQEGLRTLRNAATAIGMALALGVLALTVGLMRGESASELRTLTATGATSATRRALTAATAGGLALLGVVLGTVGAYVAMVATHLSKLGALTPVPILNLVVIAVGTPLIAAGTGWLSAGREPDALTQQLVQ